MKYLEIDPKEAPLPLLLEADPSDKMIKSYLPDSWCYAAKSNGEVVGVCIAKRIRDKTAEILNISVHPHHQKAGIGTRLLSFALKKLIDKRVQRVELGTGTFGYQLAYYQRFGFRVESVIKNYFLENYEEPVFEHGIQHKDMLRLYLDIGPNSDE